MDSGTLAGVNDLIAARMRLNLSRWDRGGDGAVSMSDVTQAMADPKTRGLDAVVLATLKSEYVYHPELADHEFTPENIMSEPNADRLATTFLRYRKRLNSDALFDGSEPDPMSVRQGLRGSCSPMAGLVGLAASDPDGVKELIEPVEGGYLLHFKSGAIEVSEPTDAERLVGTQSNGVWATTVEKGFGVANFENLELTGDVYDQASTIRAPHVIRALTGKESASFGAIGAVPEMFSDWKEEAAKAEDALSADLFEETLHQVLSQESSKGQGPLMADSYLHPVTKQEQPGTHMYTVLEYLPDQRQVKLRNPWGQGEFPDLNGEARDEANDGVFEMKLDEFQTHFFGLYLPADEPSVVRGRTTSE